MPLDEATIEAFINSAGQHFTHEPPAYLECSICQSTLQNPVCCTSGAHTFCRKCLTDWVGRSARPHCPIDREPLNAGELKKAPQALQECIDALEVVCGLGEDVQTINSDVKLISLSFSRRLRLEGWTKCVAGASSGRLSGSGRR